VLLFAGLLLLPKPAAAVDPQQRCVFDNTPELAFGPYDVMSSFAATSIGLLAFTCKGKDFIVVVAISRGDSNSPLTRTLRQITDGSAVLNYNIYSDPGHTQIWGDGTFGSSPVVEIVKNNTSAVLPFYGLIPALQDPAAGRYSDILSITLNF
jgi:spore coat protein U-like protein